LAACTRIVFASNSPLQEAAAAGLELAKKHNFFETQLKEYAERRDVLAKAFDRLGVNYTLPQGSYFMLLVRLGLLSLPLSICGYAQLADADADFSVIRISRS
jgi:aspartate/methionine/tyrosine aminotransferase